MRAENKIRVFYASAYSIYGFLLPFLPVLLHDKGFSDAEVAFILSGAGLAATATPLILSHFSDRHARPKLLLAALLACAALFLACYNFADHALAGFVITCLVFGCLVPVLISADSYTLRYLADHSTSQTAEDSRLPGLRAIGSVGFVVPALAMVLLKYFISVTPAAIFYLASGAALISFCTALNLPELKPSEQRLAAPSLEALRIACTPRFRFFFIATLICGSGTAMFYIVQPRILQELGCNNVQIGLISSLGVLAETLLMPFTASLIQRLGEWRIVRFGMFALLIRLLVMGCWPKLFILVPLQLLHGPLVVGLYIATPLILARGTSSGVRFSLQSLYSTLNLGVTRILGAWLLALLLNLTGLAGLLNLRLGSMLAATFVSLALFIMLLGGRSTASTTTQTTSSAKP